MDHITTEITTPGTSPAPLYSRLAADPVVGDLVELFANEMPERVNALEVQANRRDWNELARTAHQLKGSGGSYGFDEVTPSAARLEAAARDAGNEETILAALNDLLGICRRVRAGTK